MTKTTLAYGCALAALSIGTAPTFAQSSRSPNDTAPTAASPAAPTAAPAPANPAAPADEHVGEESIVTRSARAERRFEGSYAANVLTQNDIEKLAPINMADLLGNLPGIQVESTGGEVQNITRVRGIPTDDGLA